MSNKTYESYKDSGIDWIGEIPIDWEIDKIKHQTTDEKFSIVDGPFGTQLHNDEYVDEGIPVVRVTNLDYDGNFSPENLVYITEEKYNELKRSSVKYGDFIVAKTGATIGKTGVFQGFSKGIIASSCLKITLNRNIYPTFFKYFLISDYCQTQIINGSSGSTRDTIGINQMSNIIILLPKLDNQKKIADFLDKKTSNIERSIAKNKELIALLEEKKTALINQAVTKGLDHDVPMKDSGIEWIGEIPEHWEIKNLKSFFFITNGSTPKGLDNYWNGDICWITPADYNTEDVYINKSSRYITKEGYFSCGTTLVPKGSIIVSNRAPIGLVAIANRELCTNQGCKSLRVKNEIDTKYVYYILSVNQKELHNLGRGTTFMELSSYELGNFKIPVPPITYQNKIKDFLDMEMAKIEESIDKIQEKIELLDEYKNSLIHHVVTGKIDVRDEV